MAAKKRDIWHHPTAEISTGASIGMETKIWHHSQVQRGARIGAQCTIGHNCLVAGRATLGNGVKLESNIDVWDLVTLEDDVFVGPSAVFTNDRNPRARYPKKLFPHLGQWLPTLVKRGASIGANATIICGTTIGEWACIGAGAVVTEDVPAYAIVAGVPARLMGWMCQCGTKITFLKNRTVCTVCGKCYKKKHDEVCNF